MHRYRKHRKEHNLPRVREAPRYIQEYFALKRTQKETEEFKAKRLRLACDETRLQVVPTSETMADFEVHYSDDDSLKLENNAENVDEADSVENMDIDDSDSDSEEETDNQQSDHGSGDEEEEEEQT